MIWKTQGPDLGLRKFKIKTKLRVAAGPKEALLVTLLLVEGRKQLFFKLEIQINFLKT